GACGNVATAFAWGDLIYPYVKNEKVFDCPSGTIHCVLNKTITPPRFYRTIGGSPNDTRDCTTFVDLAGRNIDYVYGVNAFSNAGPEGPWNSKYQTLPSIPEPANVIGIGDSGGSSPYSMGGGNGARDFNDLTGQIDSQRHMGVSNRQKLDYNALNVMF